MRIQAVKNSIIKPAKNIRTKFPKKITMNNFPIVAGTVGFLTPIPFASVVLFSIAKAIQIISKKFFSQDNKPKTDE